MRSRPVLRLVVGLLVVLGAAAGCGGDDGDTAPGATAAPETTTLDPGVTFEDDVTVPTEASGAPDASVTSAPAGDDEVVSEPGQVPAEFPADFPVPEGAEVEVGSVGRTDGELRLSVDYVLADADPADVHEFYRNRITDAGFSVLLDDHEGAGADYVGQLVFETDAYVGNVLVASDGESGVLLTLTTTQPD